MTLAIGSLAVALAPGASAHVTVNSTDARQGGYGKVTVRIPNESETAGTTKVSMSMPTDVLISSVRVKPHFGWTISAPTVKLATPVKQGDKTVTEAVSTITWTADKGVSIKPGTFDEFEFSAGKLPTDKTSLSFPAIQTYSDGKIVRWIEPKVAGAAEPAHPAPTLVLLPALASENAPAVAKPAANTGGKDSLARGIGGGAAIVALGGIGLGLRRKVSAGK
jgi:uncharacterized protein YcnI